MTDIPTPSRHCWGVYDITTEPVWSDGPLLPSCLVDIVADTTAAETDYADDKMLSVDGSYQKDNSRSDVDA